jgi:hypothetical protein
MNYPAASCEVSTGKFEHLFTCGKKFEHLFTYGKKFDRKTKQASGN